MNCMTWNSCEMGFHDLEHVFKPGLHGPAFCHVPNADCPVVPGRDDVVVALEVGRAKAADLDSNGWI